jgi:hypothetical protein
LFFGISPTVLAHTAKSAIAEIATAIGAAFFNRQRNNTSASDSALSGSKKDRGFILLFPPPGFACAAQISNLF